MVKVTKIFEILRGDKTGIESSISGHTKQVTLIIFKKKLETI